MKKVRKAVIPAAGLGTRVLPITKAVPKEMLPIVDKPSIQYIVEEAVRAGIEDILIITNRNKTALEDHFDHAIELEGRLAANPAKADILEAVQYPTNLANLAFIRQKETKGLGHAVLCAKNFVGDEPFVVLYGDDVILGDDPVTGQLIRAYEDYGLCSCGIKQVAPQDVSKYSSLKVENLKDNVYKVTDMIEKPAPGEEFSYFSILGRVLLTPDIFQVLENTAPGAGGEIQLTDAMAAVSRTVGMTGVDFTGERYDMGNKFDILRANIEVGLEHPETKDQLRTYLEKLSKTL